ncbi:diguanylate cyclase [Neobacillus cucumis]|uniref:histidine kinase N-terminal 7TM domain-containing diguanylate cyclase n=1 Tax=Neobacillus cucumis TaxID=1740721 RepID=UPI00203C4E49|nr:histidine kinase N-terminal 7TM domain-containing protein [Neobacillus cucumis]MCM3727778.1 diguanylate cyclase [Neobacillus cucumis]
MLNEIFMYRFTVIIAGVLSLFLCFFAQFRLKDAPGARPYILVTLFSAFFTFSYALELASPSLERIKFWLNIEYLAMPFIPVFILLMCFEYVEQKLKRYLYYVLFVIPIITIFMHETNDLHHLYYTSMGLNSDSPFPILKVEHGPWFYVHSIFLFLCLMISIITLLMKLKRAKFRFRIQIILMASGIVMPIIANYFYLNGLSPYGIDLGPVSMSISFIFHGAALLSYQMFNVTPIARDSVFESMKDGVLVLNQNGVIVDFNNAMLDVLPNLNSQVIGKSIDNGYGRLADIIRLEEELDYELCVDEEKTYYHIRFSTVSNKNNKLIGKIITFVNVTERVLLQEQLKNLASIDGLTGVYNRTFFMQESEKMLASRNLTGGKVSVIMFDIDHFKNVNDSFGHQAGDRVLAHVASLAKESLRSTDIIGRYGGEEFILLLPDTPLNVAYELAQSLRVKITESVTPFMDKEIYVTSSFGVSSAKIMGGDHGQTLQNLMREADQALYGAKRKGRDHVELFEQTLEYSS